MTKKRGRYLRSAVKRARKRAAVSLAARRAQLRALRWRRDRTEELRKEYQESRTKAALKRYRASRALAAQARLEAIRRGDLAEDYGAKKRRRESALAAFRKAIRRPYPHLSGDLDADADVLRKLENLAAAVGRNFFVTSGLRTQAEQKRLYDNRHTNPFPVAFCCPCSSKHCLGRAVDVTVGGVPIQFVIPASTIRQHGLEPLIGDEVHLEG